MNVKFLDFIFFCELLKIALKFVLNKKINNKVLEKINGEKKIIELKL